MSYSLKYLMPCKILRLTIKLIRPKTMYFEKDITKLDLGCMLIFLHF